MIITVAMTINQMNDDRGHEASMLPLDLDFMNLLQRTQCGLQSIHIFAVSTYLYLCPFHVWLQLFPLGSHACVVGMVENGHPVFWPGKEECDSKVFFLNSKWERCKKLSSPSFLYPQEVWGTKEDGWTEIIPEKRWEPPEWFPQSCWLFTTRKLACLEIPIELSGSAGLTGNIHRARLETFSGKGKPEGVTSDGLTPSHS